MMDRPPYEVCVCVCASHSQASSSLGGLSQGCQIPLPYEHPMNSGLLQRLSILGVQYSISL